MMSIELINATNTARLEKEIQGWVGKGWDLSGGLISTPEVLGQWICFLPGHEYEYRLLEAMQFVEMARLVKSLRADRFEIHEDTVYWNGRMVQWMRRIKSTTLGLVPPMVVGVPDVVSSP